MATTKTDPKLALAGNGAKKSKNYEGLTREQLIEAYRFMYMSRRGAAREKLLKRQQKIYFPSAGAGPEATGGAPGRPPNRGTAGFIRTIAIARCAWRWA